MDGNGPAEGYAVVLVRPDGERVVFSGDLDACEDWLALNGDAWGDGHFEIRPAGGAEDWITRG